MHKYSDTYKDDLGQIMMDTSNNSNEEETYYDDNNTCYGYNDEARGNWYDF